MLFFKFGVILVEKNNTIRVLSGPGDVVMYLVCRFEIGKAICDAIKQNESEVENFCSLFLAFSIRILFKLQFGGNPVEIEQLVLKKWHFE